MASVPNYGQSIHQDMPPKEGFPKLNYKKSVPQSRGPPGWMIFGAIFGMTVYGYYRVGQSNQHRRALKREQRENRVALLPFLQAEADVIYVQRLAKERALEAKWMAGVPGWRPSSDYHNKTLWAKPPTSYGN